ncbi:MAG: biopolymer transporter ExbD [Planctomycetales bacterium]
MSSSMFGHATAEPNLTPILDMVFQLITFFMLVVNFQEAAIDTSLMLPVLGSARPLDNQGQELLVLNIDAQGNLKVSGNVVDADQFLAQEAKATRTLANLRNPKRKPDEPLPVTTVIRADRSIPFSLLNKIITTCRREGFQKLSLKVMSGTGGI